MPNPLEDRGCPWGFSKAKKARQSAEGGYSVEEASQMAVYAQFRTTNYLRDIPQKDIPALITSTDFRQLVRKRRRLTTILNSTIVNGTIFRKPAPKPSKSTNPTTTAPTTTAASPTAHRRSETSGTSQSSTIPTGTIPNTKTYKRSKASDSTQSHTTPNSAIPSGKTSSTPAQQKEKRNPTKWNEEDAGRVRRLMQEVIKCDNKKSKTEERWKIISRRLKQIYDVERSWTSVKNHWNRVGRSKSGVDERRVAKPNRMTTGVQDPRSRKAARKRKHELKDQEGAEAQEGTDSEDMRLKKRLRASPSQPQTVPDAKTQRYEASQNRLAASRSPAPQSKLLRAAEDDLDHDAHYGIDEEALAPTQKQEQEAAPAGENSYSTSGTLYSGETHNLDPIAAFRNGDSILGGGEEAHGGDSGEDEHEDEDLQQALALSLQAGSEEGLTPGDEDPYMMRGALEEAATPEDEDPYMMSGALSSEENHDWDAIAGFHDGDGAMGVGPESDEEEIGQDEELERALALSLQAQQAESGKDEAQSPPAAPAQNKRKHEEESQEGDIDDNSEELASKRQRS